MIGVVGETKRAHIKKAWLIFLGCFWHGMAWSASSLSEPVLACLLLVQSDVCRMRVAHELGWHHDDTVGMCHGYYTPLLIDRLADETAIQIMADGVSLYPSGRSQLKGHVEVRQQFRYVTANTANVYREGEDVTKIELLGNVYYKEPGRLMLADKAVLNPADRTGHVEHVVYRMDTQRAHAVLPAWGYAGWVERLKNEALWLRHVNYSTCAPERPAWQIEADELLLNRTTGVAKNATLRFQKMPVLHLPYLSFPTSNARKSGFLMPIAGYSNVGGFDIAMPYYLNLAPNYDATVMPHGYTRRGMMMGGDFRFLTSSSTGVLGGNFLPKDAAFEQFLVANRDSFSRLQGVSNNRWSVLLRENTQILPNLRFNLNYQQVSDSYYLQDFSSNLAILTENQLLRQGDLTYNTDHWVVKGMLQNYQTMHPINQSEVANIYARVPEVYAAGSYNTLPLGLTFNMLGQFDQFQWTSQEEIQPEGPRYHANPILALPLVTPYGHVTPEVQWVGNAYHLSHIYPNTTTSFQRSIPRYSVDSGVVFERPLRAFDHLGTQTLEPHLYYLNVPYQNQSQIPSFDSAYMIFSTDQLFRSNRFSGMDRIGDTNQLSYALTSRWLSADTGQEKANVTVGQIRYFSKRRVQLCYAPNGVCLDSPLFLGFTSPAAVYSPVASSGMIALNAVWQLRGDYVWDPYYHATNNGDLSLHYQPEKNKVFRLGYNYLVNGNLIEMPNVKIQDNALHQATVASAWPLTEQWSGLGIYSYNISKGYGMMSFLGLQYDTCCWAARILGGRTFQSLSPMSMTPEYNNNVYVQVLLKGLGSVANSDPASTLQSYLPGYTTVF